MPLPTDTPTPTASPVPTPAPELPGDANCDGHIDSEDGILLLMRAANFDSFAPCLGLQGVNCQGLVDITDVLALLSFLGNIPFELPLGCPPLGIVVTPVPTASPTPTVTPAPTETPVSTPTLTSVSGTPTPTPIEKDANHCILALVAYQIDTALLDGEAHCTPAFGTSYTCYFGSVNAVCVSSTNYPDYTCSFATDFADCLPYSGNLEYQCFRNSPGAVECLPTELGYLSFDCAVLGGQVTCTSTPADSNFACTKQAVGFDCVAQP
jgi:hypothetical protein